MPGQMQGTFPLFKRSPRVSKTLPITMQEISTESVMKFVGAILDLSDHGLRIVTGKALRQGQEICVLQSETGMCFKRCRVVWTRPYRLSQLSEAGLQVLR
jgi:PilZ domain